MKKSHSEEDIKLNVWIGKRLSQIRLSVKPFLSQNELTRQLGVTRPTVINWVNGKQSMNTLDLLKCVRILGCHISQLFPVIGEDGELYAQEDFTGDEPYIHILTWEEIEAEALDKENARIEKRDQPKPPRKKKVTEATA